MLSDLKFDKKTKTKATTKTKTKSQTDVFRKRMKTHVKRLRRKLSIEGYVMDLMNTYSLTPSNKMNIVESTLYETSGANVRNLIDNDILRNFNTSVDTDRYRQYLFVLAKRFISVMNINGDECIDLLIDRSEIPRGINKMNFPAYVVMFYYTTFIDTHTHDYEGVLLILKHFSRCVCQIHLEKPMDVLGSIMVALDYNVSCKKR
jgi:hypothetical protein